MLKIKTTGLLFILIAFSMLCRADLLDTSHSIISLDDSNSSTSTQLKINLKNPELFYITVREPGQDYSPFVDEILLKPTRPDISGNVILKLRIPFTEKQLLPHSDSFVKKNVTYKASNQYSSCSLMISSDKVRVCKPLSLMVADDSNAVPGATYSATINIQVTTDTNERHSTAIVVRYKKRGSAIGITTNKKALRLNTDTHYSDTLSLCVFSQLHSYFDLKLESHNGTQNFLLKDLKGNLLPYQVSAQLNDSVSSLAPGQWLHGGRTVFVKHSGQCNGKKNAFIQVQLSDQNIASANPGIYNDVLTVVVRAR